MSYTGGKAALGVFHRIIGEMPPHAFYLEAFFGGGGVFKNKRPSEKSFLIDRDPEVITKIDAGAGVIAKCGDALAIVPGLALPAEAVAYFDPPYPLSTRKNRAYYKFEMTDDDHERLLALALGLKCRVLISSYPNDLYLQQLRDWRCIRFSGATRGGPKTELLWANFEEPTELHDWRYAGRNFRERLYLRRMAARTVARVDAMPPRKRGYILNALGVAINAQPGDSCRPNAPEMTRTDPGVDRLIVPNLLLSLFPGIDLLGRGFEMEGFNVVRGPDKLWGQDVRTYLPARHVFEGIIGGSPCQKFSKAYRGGDTDAGVEMVLQFARCVTEAQPIWFLLECVPGVPDVAVPGYKVQRFNLAAAECGSAQYRNRSFQFGCRDRSVLVIPRGEFNRDDLQPAALASDSKKERRRTWPEFCALQGLPPDFELPGWSLGAKYRAVGNGVPVPMARVIAAAIRIRRVTGTVRLCICQCGREVPVGKTMATDACRKRMQRARDRAGVTQPGPVTPAASQLSLLPAA